MTGHPWSEKRLHGRCIFAWQGDDGICLSSGGREKRGKRRLNFSRIFSTSVNLCTGDEQRVLYAKLNTNNKPAL